VAQAIELYTVENEYLVHVLIQMNLRQLKLLIELKLLCLKAANLSWMWNLTSSMTFTLIGYWIVWTP